MISQISNTQRRKSEHGLYFNTSQQNLNNYSSNLSFQKNLNLNTSLISHQNNSLSNRIALQNIQTTTNCENEHLSRQQYYCKPPQPLKKTQNKENNNYFSELEQKCLNLEQNLNKQQQKMQYLNDVENQLNRVIQENSIINENLKENMDLICTLKGTIDSLDEQNKMLQSKQIDFANTQELFKQLNSKIGQQQQEIVYKNQQISQLLLIDKENQKEIQIFQQQISEINNKYSKQTEEHKNKLEWIGQQQQLEMQNNKLLIQKYKDQNSQLEDNNNKCKYELNILTCEIDKLKLVLNQKEKLIQQNHNQIDECIKENTQLQTLAQKASKFELENNQLLYQLNQLHNIIEKTEAEQTKIQQEQKSEIEFKQLQQSQVITTLQLELQEKERQIDQYKNKINTLKDENYNKSIQINQSQLNLQELEKSMLEINKNLCKQNEIQNKFLLLSEQYENLQNKFNEQQQKLIYKK